MNYHDAEDKEYIKAIMFKAARMWMDLGIPTRDEIAATLAGRDREKVANLLTRLLLLDTAVDAMAAELSEAHVSTLQAVKIGAVLQPGDVIETRNGVVVVFEDGLALAGSSEEVVRRRALNAQSEVKVKLRDRAERN